MYVLFVWWGDGQITQTTFGTLELAQAGDAALGGHQKAVDSLIVQVEEKPAYPWVEINGDGKVRAIPHVDESLNGGVPMGGRRGRKG